MHVELVKQRLQCLFEVEVVPSNLVLVIDLIADLLNLFDNVIFFDCEWIVHFNEILTLLYIQVSSSLLDHTNLIRDDLANVKSFIFVVKFDMLLDSGVNKVVLCKIRQTLIILVFDILYRGLSELNEFLLKPEINDIQYLLVQSPLH